MTEARAGSDRQPVHRFRAGPSVRLFKFNI